MISARMARPIKVLLMAGATIALAALAAACGTDRIKVSQANALHNGAVLFNQRCSGCHTLSYAAAHGSATNVRSREIVNGPDFNIRCERPVTRVVYAIENGGFSGAIMPQNIVVGQDAKDVAQFVATYAGRQAPPLIGVTPCVAQPIGSVPAASAGGNLAGTTGTPSGGGQTPAPGTPTTTHP
jgi:mono/diheme cytochrome c family protein